MKKQTETTVIVDLRVTFITPGDVTSESAKRQIINDIYARLNPDDINVKNIKTFLREGK